MTSATEKSRSTVNQTFGDPLTQLWENASEVTRVAVDAYVTGLDALMEQQRAVQQASEQWLSGMLTGGSVVQREAASAAQSALDEPAAAARAASTGASARKTTSRPRAGSKRRDAAGARATRQDKPAPSASRSRRSPAGAGTPKRGAAGTSRRPAVTPAAKAAFANVVGPALSRWTREGYDSLTAAEIIERLPQFSQVELGEVAAFEQAHQARQTILQRIDTLRAQEPTPGYDELTAADIETLLAAGDSDLATRVRDYERLHKDRAGVLRAAATKLG
jgi:hypothetical protein